MPGAQPRRSPVARLASSARRGANVPAGVPGVYRVPRVRTVTVQANDTGAAAAVPVSTQDLSVASTSRRAFGNQVSKASFPGYISTVVATPVAQLAGGGWVASTQGSSVGDDNAAPIVEQVRHAFTVPDPTGLTDPVSVHVGGWISSSTTTGSAAAQLGNLVHLADVASVSAHWYTPTELTAGDVLFTTGAPGISPAGATFHRFDLVFDMDPTQTAVLILANDACVTGEGYAWDEFTFHRVSSSGVGTVNAFEYAYIVV